MAKRKNITTTQLALMTAAAVISLRGLPMMAQEELTMFFYIFFATFLFLIPAALVGAELGSAFADRGGGVYTWVKEAFNRHLGFSAIFLQWIQNVVWYPTVLGFAAASIAYMIGVPALAQNGLYVGLFSIAMYWCATLVTLRGTSAISGITSKGFLIGTVLPGVVVIVMAVIWMAGGNEIALKEIPAGVSQIVNVDAATIANRPASNPFGLFTLGALAVAIITPYDQINLQSGLFTTFQIAFERYHVGWLSNVMGLLVAFGALAGVMSWISGPSRGLLWTARDGALPCFLQKTNKNGVQLNILIIQGCIVTLLSSLYIVMDDVSVAFFLLSALTVGLYLIMYMMMYAAGIRLRYTQPKLIRSYRVPGGNTGMWLIGGVGFLAVLFSFIVTFFPPSQLPVGSPATYTWLVVTGTAVFLAIPFIISFAMDKRNARRTPEA